MYTCRDCRRATPLDDVTPHPEDGAYRCLRCADGIAGVARIVSPGLRAALEAALAAADAAAPSPQSETRPADAERNEADPVWQPRWWAPFWEW